MPFERAHKNAHEEWVTETITEGTNGLGDATAASHSRR